MMEQRFGRSLLFAVAAALPVPFLHAGLGPAFFGVGLQMYLVAAGAAYLAVIAPTRSRAIAGVAVMVGLGLWVLLLSTSLATTAVGVAGALALVRSGLFYRNAGWRGLAAELVLGGGGLALAAWLAGPSLLSAALSVWGYFLVQGLFFVVGGVKPKRSTRPGDPFDVARGQLLRLMEEEPG